MVWARGCSDKGRFAPCSLLSLTGVTEASEDFHKAMEEYGLGNKYDYYLSIVDCWLGSPGRERMDWKALYGLGICPSASIRSL